MNKLEGIEGLVLLLMRSWIIKVLNQDGFEYKSRNFMEHGHDPDLCDLIVCWIHDWEECPVEVLELNTTVKRLPAWLIKLR